MTYLCIIICIYIHVLHFICINFITDASGMDFRAMLKKRKYQKWKTEEAEQEKVDLKEVEKPMPALKKVERVCILVWRFTHTSTNFNKNNIVQNTISYVFTCKISKFPIFFFINLFIIFKIQIFYEYVK